MVKIKAPQQCFMLSLDEQARIIILKAQVVANTAEKKTSIPL